MSVVSKMEDGVFDHAIDISRFEEGMKRRTIGFLKEMSDDINRLLSDSPTQLQADRMRSLLDQVDSVIVDAHQSAKVDMRSQLLDFAPVEEKATTKIMNDSLDADLFSPKMTEAQLRAVVDDSLVRGALASDWWDRLESNTKNKITKGIQLGIAEGESMSQIKTRLLGKTTGEFETYEVGGKTRRRMRRVGGWIQASNREAEAVIRTSVHNVASTVRDKTYLNNLDVIDMVESVATLDGRTTPLCASYDGLRWNADNHEPVGGHGKVYRSTPRHWNCRSTHVPVMGELEKLDAIAKKKGIKIPPASRASITGKQRATMNMDKWLRKQGNEMQDKIVGGKTKGNLFRKKPKMTLKDFTDRRGDPLSIHDLRDKFGAEFLQITRTAVVRSAPQTPYMNSAFVDVNLPKNKSDLANATVDAERELAGIGRLTGSKKADAHYRPDEGKVYLGTNPNYAPDHRHGIGVFAHEFGHHMDHSLGRKVLNADDDVFGKGGSVIRSTRTAYGMGREGSHPWKQKLSDTNVFEDARLKDEKAFLESGGYIPKLRPDLRDPSRQILAGSDNTASNRRRRLRLEENQMDAEARFDIESADVIGKAFKARRKAKLLKQEEELESQFRKFGLGVDDVKDILNKDTDWEGLEGVALNKKLAKISQALKDKDAGHLLDELGSPTDWGVRHRTYEKGFGVSAFSDLIGSACLNRYCGRNPKRHGGFGHTTRYYNESGNANTEVFANITALQAFNEPFWDTLLDTFTPNMNKAYKELLDASNKTKWENKKQRMFSKDKKEKEILGEEAL